MTTLHNNAMSHCIIHNMLHCVTVLSIKCYHSAFWVLRGTGRELF